MPLALLDTVLTVTLRAKVQGDSATWTASLLGTRWSIGPSRFDASSVPVIGFLATYSGSILVNVTYVWHLLTEMSDGEPYCAHPLTYRAV